ncbi:MAG TPA: PstS family phosphate ABC transporter substrate-binding protein [Bacteroidales bacterium]|nr:PstS family phosphate ABC transporter substrate-binding protein [Bacteroidales bacterium]
MKYTATFRSIAAALILGAVGSFTACNPGSSGSGGQKGDALKGKITISGAFALYPMTVRWAEEFKKLHPGVTVNISAGGAGKGMADALSKMVDLGMFSKEVSPEERAKGAWYIAVAKDAVLPTVSSANPVLKDLKTKGMTREQFAGIFLTGTIKTWGQAARDRSLEEISVFTRSDACGAAEMWAKYLDKTKKQEDLVGLGVNGDPGVADAVRRDPGGIGFNNLNFVYDMENRKPYPGIEVVPIDLNGNGTVDPEENFYGTLDQVVNAIQTGRYPSPPARDLYFVSAGKPTDRTVIAFLQWILTDGQKFVPEAGYVTLSPEKLQAGMEKLK